MMSLCDCETVCPEMITRPTRLQAKTPMQFLSVTQRVNDSLRLESRNRSQRSQATEVKTVYKEQIAERRADRDRPTASWRSRRWPRERTNNGTLPPSVRSKAPQRPNDRGPGEGSNLAKNRPLPVKIAKGDLVAKDPRMACQRKMYPFDGARTSKCL